ncbi:MAG: YcxB family protein [Flavobacterium sp.]
MENPLKIIYKPNIETLMKVSRYLLLNIKFIKYGPVFFIALLLITYWSRHMGMQSGYEPKQSIADYIQLLIFPGVLALVYFGTLSSMKKNILNNKRNFETQSITFDKESYTQQAETFKIESFWSETYQIKETSDWFLIYPKKNSAMPIVKSDLSPEEYNSLKTLFNSLPIKKSLK